MSNSGWRSVFNLTKKDGSKMLADMHTHSEFSHDSSCKTEDMLLSEIERGVNVFAVTDHFDTASHNNYDIFTPIKMAHAKIDRLRALYPNVEILKGIEIGEGFWFPKAAKRITEELKCYVIIGAVHLVRHGKLS